MFPSQVLDVERSELQNKWTDRAAVQQWPLKTKWLDSFWGSCSWPLNSSSVLKCLTPSRMSSPAKRWMDGWRVYIIYIWQITNLRCINVLSPHPASLFCSLSLLNRSPSAPPLHHLPLPSAQNSSTFISSSSTPPSSAEKPLSYTVILFSLCCLSVPLFAPSCPFCNFFLSSSSPPL